MSIQGIIQSVKPQLRLIHRRFETIDGLPPAKGIFALAIHRAKGKALYVTTATEPIQSPDIPPPVRIRPSEGQPSAVSTEPAATKAQSPESLPQANRSKPKLKAAKRKAKRRAAIAKQAQKQDKTQIKNGSSVSAANSRAPGADSAADSSKPRSKQTKSKGKSKRSKHVQEDANSPAGNDDSQAMAQRLSVQPVDGKTSVTESSSTAKEEAASSPSLKIRSVKSRPGYLVRKEAMEIFAERRGTNEEAQDAQNPGLHVRAKAKTAMSSGKTTDYVQNQKFPVLPLPINSVLMRLP